jgi:hypothetical protein
MRLWIHKIWRKENSSPLRVCGPRENEKLEALIRLHGEMVVARAWFEYVNADPPPYTLEPVIRHTKDHQLRGTEYETYFDGASVTYYPLSAFLYDPSSYIVEALLIAETNEKHLCRGLEFAFAPSRSVQSQWTVPETEAK